MLSRSRRFSRFLEEIRTLSVAGHLGVDLKRPGIDSAGQVHYIFEVLVLEKSRRLEAPDAHVAVNDDLIVRLEFGKPLAQLGQGYVHRALEAVDCHLPVFANIQEDGFAAGIQLGLHILNRHINGRVGLRLKHIEEHKPIIRQRLGLVNSFLAKTKGSPEPA